MLQVQLRPNEVKMTQRELQAEIIHFVSEKSTFQLLWLSFIFHFFRDGAHQWMSKRVVRQRRGCFTAINLGSSSPFRSQPAHFCQLHPTPPSLPFIQTRPWRRGNCCSLRDLASQLYRKQNSLPSVRGSNGCDLVSLVSKCSEQLVVTWMWSSVSDTVWKVR